MATTGATVAPRIVSGTTELPKSASSGAGGNTLGSTTDQTIAGNFQTFLTLLTTQLQNQNPLDPLDTNQFTQQLVQFAGVEQQLKTNDSLSTLISLQQATQATEALQFVGKTAVVSGNTTMLSNATNAKAVWELNVPMTGDVSISIANSSGQTVFTGNFSANAGDNQTFTWDGLGNDGTQWPDGLYTLTATTNTSGKTTAIPVQVGGIVNSVDISQSPPLLSINGQSFTISQVKAIGG